MVRGKFAKTSKSLKHYDHDCRTEIKHCFYSISGSLDVSSCQYTSRHLKQKEQSFISKISIIISKSSIIATYGSNSDLLSNVFIKRVYFGIKGFMLKNPFRVIKDVSQLSWCYQIFLVLSNSLTI